MIEQLLADLTASTEFGKLFFIGLIGGFALLMSATFIKSENESEYHETNNWQAMVAVLGVAILMITLVAVLSQAGGEAGIKIEINHAHMENIMLMSCSEIREDLLTLLENKSKKKEKTIYEYKQKHYDWEQDYYYTKCELPLREEVLKLQDPVFEIPMEIIEEVVMPMIENKTEGFKSDYTGYGKQYEDWK